MSESFRKEQFDDALRDILAEAKAQGKTMCRVISKDLHDRVVDVSKVKNHRMPMACKAMWKVWEEQGGDESKIICLSAKDGRESSTIELEFFTGDFHWSFSRIMKVIAHGFIGKRLTHKELIK